ncbi:MAG: hypothetical protein QOH13_364, partial [Thermoleophilaceae bacterium]|nr:hypothetical protein [Thermoleophilaceae bacterium]
MPISLWVEVDGVFRIADVNDAGCDFSGMTREQLVGASAQEVGGNAVRAKRDMLTASSRDQPVSRELT